MDERKVIYFEDELNDEFSTAVIEPRRIDESYVYRKDSAWKSFTHFFWYRIIATPIAFFYTKIAHGHKIVGKDRLRKFKRSGYFLYGNHTHALADSVIPSMITLPKDAYVIVHPSNVSIPYIRRVATSLGALPLPDTLGAYKNFISAVRSRYRDGCAVVIYPEAHIWPYYTKIRPFKDDSFHYPVSLCAPVFCFTNTYQKRRLSKKPRIVTYIDGPFFPKDGLSATKQRADLRNQVYECMCERAKSSNVVMIEYKRKGT